MHVPKNGLDRCPLCFLLLLTPEAWNQARNRFWIVASSEVKVSIRGVAALE